MKKILTPILPVLGLVLSGTSFISAQNEKTATECEVAPTTVKTNPTTNQAMWSVLYNYDLLAATGSNGKAGVCVFSNTFWVSRWQNDTIYRIDAAGALIEKFTIPGVTGVRSLTTDGTSIYAGINTNSIKKIDPVTKTLVSSITAPIVNVRSLTYDATANSGAGGFWMSDWGTDITLTDMNGATLSTIPAASHGLMGMYGTAFDNVSSGGPYLWVFDQTTTTGQSDIVQLNIAAQSPTGIVHDVMVDVGTPQGNTSGSAGGIFFYSPAPSVLILVGVLQGSPTNRLFGYDVSPTGISENMNPDGFINIFPNPVKDMVNINVNKQNNDDVELQVFDAMGKIVFNKNTRAQNNYINFSKYPSGLYFVKTTYNGKTASSKFIKQ